MRLQRDRRRRGGARYTEEAAEAALTNVNSLERGCLLKLETIGSAQCHSGSAITNR